MEKKEVKLSDISRILVGNAPAEFLLEVFIRTLIVYMALQIVMRFLGKRMNGKITITEMTLVLTMGAIVSVPMQSPERGILQGLLVLACAFIYQRVSDHFILKSDWYEKLAQGKMSLLVKDGVINHKEMSQARISVEQLFCKLRAKEIYQLGEVQRVYIEACGLFTIYKSRQAKPGLSTVPEEDQEDVAQQQQDTLLCKCCGECAPEDKLMCRNCGNKTWTKAVV